MGFDLLGIINNIAAFFDFPVPFQQETVHEELECVFKVDQQSNTVQRVSKSNSSKPKVLLVSNDNSFVLKMLLDEKKDSTQEASIWKKSLNNKEFYLISQVNNVENPIENDNCFQNKEVIDDLLGNICILSCNAVICVMNYSIVSTLKGDVNQLCYLKKVIQKAKLTGLPVFIFHNSEISKVIPEKLSDDNYLTNFQSQSQFLNAADRCVSLKYKKEVTLASNFAIQKMLNKSNETSGTAFKIAEETVNNNERNVKDIPEKDIKVLCSKPTSSKLNRTTDHKGLMFPKVIAFIEPKEESFEQKVLNIGVIGPIISIISCTLDKVEGCLKIKLQFENWYDREIPKQSFEVFKIIEIPSQYKPLEVVSSEVFQIEGLALIKVNVQK